MHAPVYESRLKGLANAILPHLQVGDRILDVGCGGGGLGRTLLESPASPRGLTVHGLERVRRGQELIDVREYDGVTIPFDDKAYDAVIIADVLHHEQHPERLLAECVRVARRLLIVKDHKVDGIFAHARICLMDWAANDPYGVPCLYRYPSLANWRSMLSDTGMSIAVELTRLRLYPFPYWLFFTDRLQYLAILMKSSEPRVAP